MIRLTEKQRLILEILEEKPDHGPNIVRRSRPPGTPNFYRFRRLNSSSILKQMNLLEKRGLVKLVWKDRPRRKHYTLTPDAHGALCLLREFE